MIYPIRYFGDPILRQVARPVTRFDANLRALAADMFETMFDANGIGLAATQIGIPHQLFVAVEVDPFFEDPEDEDEGDGEDEGEEEDPQQQELQERNGVGQQQADQQRREDEARKQGGTGGVEKPW